MQVEEIPIMVPQNEQAPFVGRSTINQEQVDGRILPAGPCRHTKKGDDAQSPKLSSSLRKLYRLTRTFSWRKVGVHRNVRAPDDASTKVAITSTRPAKAEHRRGKSDSVVDYSGAKKQFRAGKMKVQPKPSSLTQAIIRTRTTRRSGLRNDRKTPLIASTSNACTRRVEYKTTLLVHRLQAIKKEKEDELKKIESRKEEILAKYRNNRAGGCSSKVTEENWGHSQELVTSTLLEIREARKENSNLIKLVQEERERNRTLALEMTAMRDQVKKEEAAIGCYFDEQVDLENRLASNKMNVIYIQQKLASAEAMGYLEAKQKVTMQSCIKDIVSLLWVAKQIHLLENHIDTSAPIDQAC